MNIKRKIVVGIMACSFAVLILLLAAGLIAPKLIDMKSVKDVIRDRVQKELGAKIEFERLGLHFFPYPYVIVDQVELSIPPGVTGKAVSLRVHPRILPLFLGKVKIAGLRLDSADLNYTLTKTPATENPASQPFSLYELGKKIQSIVSTLPEFQIPNLDFHVNNARVSLFDAGRKLLELRSVNSHLEGPPAGRQFTVNCASNLWQSISLNGLLDTNTFEGSGQIRLTQIQPQRLSGYLFPDSALQLVDAPADLTIDFKTDGPGHLQAEATGSAVHLKFQHAKEDLSIQNARFKAEFQVDKNSTTLSLSELSLDYPQLKLSANLALTQNTPPLNLQIKGSQIDVASTRQTALAVLGKNEVIKNIFDIVKGGSVPSITVATQGQSLSDLGNMDNIVIRGQMHNGEISIPGIQFDLKDASGEVVISHGILEGQNLQARLGNSLGQNGKLKLGLIGDVAPIHLETDVRVELSQLPPILKRLIDDKDFQKELALLKELKGSANGKLVLGEDTENMKVKVDASDIHLSAHYERLPHPLQITGGNFTYDETGISVGELSGRLGKSSFSALSGGLDLGKAQNLEITSGNSHIFLAEILPWLSSFDAMGELNKYYGGGKSTITLSAINWKGPLFDPKKCLFNISGDIEDLVLKNLSQHSVPVTIASAKFKADPETFNYTDGRISMLDSTLKMSGTHGHYFKGFDHDIRMTFEGRMGSKAIQWLSNTLHAPQQIHIRPLTLSTSRLSYSKNGEKTFSASLALQDGLKISADILLGPDKLVIEKLSIRDKSSRATMGISLYKKLLTFSFKGNLHKATFDQVASESPWPAGWLEGDFKAQIDMEKPLKSEVWGKLKGKDIIYSWKPDIPLKINDFAVTGTKHEINLQSADISLKGNRLHATGKVVGSIQSLLVDMDITTKTLDLAPLIQAMKNTGENNGGGKPSKFQSIPVQGNIRFKGDRFNIGKFTWNPLHADISLNNDTADVTLKKAVICGISTPGTLKVSPQILKFDLETMAKDQELKSTLDCFADEALEADGTYNLKGRFQGSGKVEDLLKTATGHVTFTAADGHIYREFILINVLKFLNSLEVLKGKVNFEDLGKKGFGYHSFRVKANLKNRKILFDESVLHSAPMAVTAAGEHNLQNGRLDLTLLVAPLVTLDRIFEHIPLIGGILNTLDTIPLSVKGTFDNIHVYPLAPSAVGYELEEMMKKTVERPIRLIHGGKASEP